MIENRLQAQEWIKVKEKDATLGRFLEERKSSERQMKTLAKVQGRTEELLRYRASKVSVFSIQSI